MKCPHCGTENRDDRENCYQCEHDLSMLRLVVNKAKQHYNVALEHAERQRYGEAVNELRNTIELYHDFAPAHVVLGTIHAKQQDFESARREWEVALQTDNNLYKAYQYLDKLEHVREALPTVRRLWGAVWALSIAFVILALGAGYILWPRQDFERLQSAMKAFDDDRPSLALARFDELTNSRSEAVAEAARRWKQAIRKGVELREELRDREVEFLFQEVNYDLAHGNLEAARQALADIEKSDMKPYFTGRLMTVKETLREATLAEWDERLAEVRRGEATPRELAALVGRIAELYPNDPRVKNMRRTAEEMAKDRPNEIFDRIARDFEQTGDRDETLVKLDSFLSRHPEHQPALDLRRKIVEMQLKDAQAALKQSPDEPSPEAIEKLENVAAADPSGRIAAEIERLRQESAERIKKSEADRLESLTLKDLLDKGETIFKLPEEVTGLDQRYLDTLATQARRRLAREAANYMVGFDWQYQRLTIPAEVALRTIQMAPFVLENYPGSWVRPKTLFYRGASYMRLGDVESAEEQFALLKQRHPDSIYNKLVPTVRDIAQKTLGLPARTKGAPEQP